MRIGSLFSGYGGLDLAVEAVFDADTVWTSDSDPAASKILAHHTDVPNLGDITTVDWSTVEPVDILTGGFPCQDVSAAGRRAGLRPGTRTGLWSHMVYAISQLRPRYVIAENVRGLLNADAHSQVEPCPICLGDRPDGHLRALGAVLADLADLGYDAQWCGLRAADVGAPHGRFRIFILAADTGGDRPQGRQRGEGSSDLRRRPADTGTSAAADASDFGHKRGGRARRRWLGSADGSRELLPTPDATHGRRTSRTAPLLAGAVDLLPSPRATDGAKGGPNQRGSSGDLMLPSAAASLLPTPNASLGEHRRDNGQRRERRRAQGRQVSTADAVRDLLPTPTTVDGNGGRNATANRSAGAEVNIGWTLSDLAYVEADRLLPTPLVGSTSEAAHNQISGQFRTDMEQAIRRFGQYADAIARWEPIIGRPAPNPTVNGRLSPLFVEWMMGLPEGWVTAVPGLSRANQLKVLGNGVVPQQAVAALDWLITVGGAL